MLSSPALLNALARIGYGARGVIYLMVGGASGCGWRSQKAVPIANSSGWRVVENRVMLLSDVGPMPPHSRNGRRSVSSADGA